MLTSMCPWVMALCSYGVDMPRDNIPGNSQSWNSARSLAKANMQGDLLHAVEHNCHRDSCRVNLRFYCLVLRKMVVLRIPVKDCCPCCGRPHKYAKNPNCQIDGQSAGTLNTLTTSPLPFLVRSAPPSTATLPPRGKLSFLCTNLRRRGVIKSLIQCSFFRLNAGFSC